MTMEGTCKEYITEKGIVRFHTGKLSEEERKAILYDNAAKLIGIK